MVEMDEISTEQILLVITVIFKSANRKKSGNTTFCPQ